MSVLIKKVIKAGGWFHNGDSKHPCLDESEAQEIIDLVEQSQWISVDARLPDNDIAYLVFAEVVDILNEGSMYINNIAVYSTIDNEWLINGIVTHWQPLPSAPNTDTKK